MTTHVYHMLYNCLRFASPAEADRRLGGLEAWRQGLPKAKSRRKGTMENTNFEKTKEWRKGVVENPNPQNPKQGQRWQQKTQTLQQSHGEREHWKTRTLKTKEQREGGEKETLENWNLRKPKQGKGQQWKSLSSLCWLSFRSLFAFLSLSSLSFGFLRCL